jgi:hypothetical protein
MRGKKFIQLLNFVEILDSFQKNRIELSQPLRKLPYRYEFLGAKVTEAAHKAITIL